MWCTPLFPSLPGPLYPGVVIPDRVLSMGQTEINICQTELLEIELFSHLKCILMLN